MINNPVTYNLRNGETLTVTACKDDGTPLLNSELPPFPYLVEFLNRIYAEKKYWKDEQEAS